MFSEQSALELFRLYQIAMIIPNIASLIVEGKVVRKIAARNVECLRFHKGNLNSNEMLREIELDASWQCQAVEMDETEYLGECRKVLGLQGSQ